MTSFRVPLCLCLVLAMAACSRLPAAAPVSHRETRADLAWRLSLFIERVERSRDEGLEPRCYGTERLSALRRRLIAGESDDPRAEAEETLKPRFVSFARHLSRGRVDPEQVRRNWRRAGLDRIDEDSLFDSFMTAANPDELLETLAPPNSAYRRLATLLRRYRSLAATDRSERVEERIRTIEANLERWRWMPRELGERYLEVNIPAYMVTFRDSGNAEAMRAIVGRNETPTPVFASAIDQVVINPSWHVPRSIVEKEIIPELRKDGSYLAKHHMELRGPAGEPLDSEAIPWKVIGAGDLELRVRQLPGTWNALGQIKFQLPNPEDVYLHGTPARNLFEKPARAFTHGCIRIEDPMTIAARILAGTGWDRASLEAAIRSGETKRIRLGEPLPVYLDYWTAWVEEDGSEIFVPDIYGIDSEIIALSQGAC